MFGFALKTQLAKNTLISESYMKLLSYERDAIFLKLDTKPNTLYNLSQNKLEETKNKSKQ